MPSDLHHQVIKETSEIQGFSSRIYQRAGPIAFVAASGKDNKSKDCHNEQEKYRRGKEISSFYSNVICKGYNNSQGQDLHDEDIGEKLPPKHDIMITPHEPISIPISSPGYKYLQRYGWDPTHGLGRPGRNGRIKPIKAGYVKLDTRGIGCTNGKSSSLPPPPPKVNKSIKQINLEYNQEKHQRKRLFEELNGR